jgi:glycosyltransferase involved in cell wall biosynthesis
MSFIKIKNVATKFFIKIRSWRLRRIVSSARTNANLGEYTESPQVSAIVQVFNKRGCIGKLIRRLQNSPIDELIVIDDGSVDGTWTDAMALLKGRNEFLLRANDLFEIRAYDRALSMARGEYAVLLQDDDLPPEGSDWVLNALKLFESDARLLILGGRKGLSLLLPDKPDPGEKPIYTTRDGLTGKPGVNKYNVIHAPGYEVQNISFQYVMSVNRAPMWVRRLPFIEEIGIDQGFAPFQCDDVDSCLRAWDAGWRVGLYSANFNKFCESGMKIFNASQLEEQAESNWRIIYDRYGNMIADGNLAQRIERANQTLAFGKESKVPTRD